MRVTIMDAPVDALSFDETVGLAREAMVSRKMLHQVSMNAAKLVKMRSDETLRQDVLDSHVISADGVAIVWAGRLLGSPLPGRVNGTDLMEAMLALCAREGFRPYFLGAKPDIVAKAAGEAVKRWPGLVFAGWRDGYYAPEQEDEVVAGIRASGADCLFVGMPTPRKERFLKRNRDSLGAPFVMGVGGSLDVLAGLVPRAPLWMQRSGLEWLFRLLQEPRRMFGRYVSTNTVFVALLAKALLMRLTGAASQRSGT